MIVDDRKLIIGSANINDRSLLGERDSELGLYVEEISSSKSKVEGVIAKMRLRLMAEHLGVFCTDRSYPLLTEPASDKFYLGVWRKTAYDNMKIFDKVSCNSFINFTQNIVTLRLNKPGLSRLKKRV